MEGLRGDGSGRWDRASQDQTSEQGEGSRVCARSWVSDSELRLVQRPGWAQRGKLIR